MAGYSCFARYYDRLTQNIDYSARAAYFDRLLARHGVHGGILLDLACGTGSLSLPLAAQGYDLIGADASAEMLMQAQQKASAANRKILFLQQSMQTLDLYGTVNAVVCALDSLNHLPDVDALRTTFARVSLFLEPDGVFVFDVNSRYKHFERIGNNTFVYDCEPVFCVWQNTQRPDNTVRMDLDFFERTADGRYLRASEQFSERYFSEAELAAALADAGLSILSVYGGDRFSSPTETDERLVYAVRKKRTC